jgi:hypothetical protein
MKNLLSIICALFLTITAYSQQQHFEESVATGEETDQPKVRIGADFAMQFQGLSHHADTARLIPLGKGINLPTANFNINATLADGIEVNLTTYLSSRHHQDTWVKGGYLLVDKLPFLNSPAIDRIMDYLTLKVGVMELNYGDTHFRRTDNGNAIRNPFVGNYIIDAFTTAPALEVLFRNNIGILAMGGITTGTLNPQLVTFNAASKQYSPVNVGKELGFYGKVGYDKQLSPDFRFRATLSAYHVSQHHFGSLYNGDRAGSRFYLVMQRATGNAADIDVSSNAFTGNWGPGFTNEDNSMMLNIFTKYKGLEFFGTYEKLTGTQLSRAKFDFSQYGAEGVYRFGKDEQFFGGVKYNYANNQAGSNIDRTEVSAGWFPIKNVIMKAEYVDQNYHKFDIYGGGGGFNGVMVEAAISF